MGEGKNLVGVDIGSSAVKVCQLKTTRSGRVLQRMAKVPLPRQTIVEGQVMDAGSVVEALQRACHDGKIRQKECALSVSGQSVIIRKITVPMMTAAELDEQIHWEAEQHIPFDIKDVQVDYQVLKRRPEASGMDLLLVAAKRDQINDYVQLARDAKLRPVVCDIDAFTIQNLFEVSRGLAPDTTIALINVGASLATLNIVASGVSAFTREIANGGNSITEEIQKVLSVPYEQAEAYKCGGGAGDPSDPYRAGMVPEQVGEIIESACDAIAAEIQRSLDFFMATSGEADIARLYLTGGSVRLAPLAQAVERRTRIGTEIWLPTESLQIDTKALQPALVQQNAAELAVALGLGLRKSKESRA